MTKCIDFNLQWDLDRVPAGQSCTRGLLIDVNAALAPGAEARLPVNLALVLDRSGSMAGIRLSAAVDGTLGVLNSLTEHDRLSVVAFDSDVMALANGQAMNDSLRQQVAEALGALRTGGTTDLARGWYEGASSAADVLGSTGRRGHVVVLSDGKANRGITDPEQLGQHVAALAQRGVTSSAVGIGPDYSPLQLDAIAEHGGGRLHHCDLPSDVVDVILGELGEVREIAATNVELWLRWPHGVTLELLNDFPSVAGEGELRIQLGSLRAARTRSMALLANVGPHGEGERLPFDVQLTWRTADTDERHEASRTTHLNVVPRNEIDDAERLVATAARIADLWEATLVYQATRLNEQGNFGDAVGLLNTAENELIRFTCGLPDESSRAMARHDLIHRLQRAWHGAAKRSTMDLSKKMMRSHVDPRRVRRGGWSDEFRE